MHEHLGARGTRGAGCGARAFHVHGLEGLGTRVGKDADQIDDGASAFDRASRGIGKAQVGLYGHDLADTAHRLQVAGKIGTAHGRTDAPAVECQGTYGMAPNETGAAKHCCQASLLTPQHACHLRTDGYRGEQ